jgi:hypothetical protein
MIMRFHDHPAQPVRGTGEQWDGGEIYLPAAE